MTIKNYKLKIKNLTGGQSLFELVIAIGVSALIIVVLVSLVSKSLQNAAFSKNQTLAGRYAQEATEWLRSQRDNDTSNFITNIELKTLGVPRCFNTLDTNGWANIGACSSDQTITGTILTRQITFTEFTVSDANGNIKNIIEADVTVSWTDSKGLHQVSNATDFADWRQR